jgi:protein-tyrosine phosphatase
VIRKVKLDEVSGHLFLSEMPGRERPLNDDIQAINDLGVDYVVCLTYLNEIKWKSPDYAGAIENETLPFKRVEFGIEDRNIPSDKQGFLQLANQIAEDLKAGVDVLIHCGAGIGRTGTLAASVLIQLGYDKDEALLLVTKAQSKPETPEQEQLVTWVFDQVS